MESTGLAAPSRRLAGLPPTAFGDIDPDPDDDRIAHNVVRGNGGTSPIPFLPAVDVLFVPVGTGNSWRANRYERSFPAALPACQQRCYCGGQSRSISGTATWST